MNRRTRGVLLAGSFAVATVVVLAVTVVVLVVGLARGLDPAPAQVASDDREVERSEATGLPLPKRRVLTTAKNSPFIKSIHVETPLDLAALLGFYRAELSKRRWTENDGAVVEPDRAVIPFTTTDGPALLRLIHEDERTIADLSLRKPAAANAGILPRPGQVRLMLGNDTDEEAVITINEQTIELAARAGSNLTDAPDAGRKAPDSPEIDLPPGKYKVTLKVASNLLRHAQFSDRAAEASPESARPTQLLHTQGPRPTPTARLPMRY